MNNHPKTVIVIVGPTAVGKTAVAINVATAFATEILSADSRQCYKELNIGVARPTEEELATIPHHFIATHSIHDNIDAAYYEEYGNEILNHLFRDNKVAVVTGGTGLYIKALLEGMDAIPAIPDEVRNEIRLHYLEHGIEWLYNELLLKDPLFAQQGSMKNPQRMMRALEVAKTTGKSILSFQSNKKENRSYNVIKVGLMLPKEKLHERINLRALQMMEQGLLKEVKSVAAFKKLNALQTVGYKELFDYIDGSTSLNEAVTLIQLHTRQYAKRQMTWFKKDTETFWFDREHEDKIITHLKAILTT